MKLMKWLKRDRSNRRCSDSNLTMVTSPCGDKNARNTSLDGEDSFRKEYLQALSEFRARRSLGLNNINLDKTFDSSPDRNNKNNLNNNTEEKCKSERKPKRRSLPETPNNNQILSQTLPQIQFLFSNQIFMPGNKPQSKKKLRKQKVICSDGKKRSATNSSASPSSPVLKTSTVDFDADDSASPNSPPPEFYRNNSLPYSDRDATMPTRASGSPDKKTTPKQNGDCSSNPDSQQPLIINSSRSDIYESLRKFSETSARKSDEKAKAFKEMLEQNADPSQGLVDGAELADTSTDSITRKLEENCHIRNKFLWKGHFRGTPLFRRSNMTIDSLKGQEPSYTGEGLSRAHWDAVHVTLRGALDAEYTARDIDILTSVRHPNILLLMGIAYDTDHRIECVFEECTATLYELLYEQKVHISLNTCVEYLSDIASATSHLFNNGYVHTAISSHTIVVTSKGLAKLFGFELCSKVRSSKSQSPKKKKKCEPYKLIYSSPEPEYENLKGRLRRSDVSESEKRNSASQSNRMDQCTPQNIEERELLTHYRWQAPELFDDSDKQVVPRDTSDVYSICLVLWECFNGVIPWRSLSYKNLSDLYLLWQTGIRLKKGRYPVLIQDILREGLSLNHEDRMSIKDLCARLTHVKNFVHFGSDSFIGEMVNYPVTNTDLDKSGSGNEQKMQTTNDESRDEDNQTRVSIHYVSEDEEAAKQEKSESNSPIDLTKPRTCLNLSSILPGSNENLDNTDESEELFFQHNQTSPDPYTTMHKTDSTEYCSFLTPDVRRFASRLHNPDDLPKPSKLAFDETMADSPDASLQEKINRLNSNFTPKSYKPLEIKTPPPDKMQLLSKLAKRIGSADRCKKKSNYHFDIMNTSLPNTPIARNTKIRKFAWLSGENDGDNEDVDDIDDSNPNNNHCPEDRNEIEENRKGSEIDNKDADNSQQQTAHHSIDLDETQPIMSDTVDAIPFLFHHDLDNERLLEGLSVSSALYTDRNPFRRSKRSVSSLEFRTRSQSWSSKSRSNMRGSENNITGIDIKPLVAIHEKWIEEAKQKHSRSLSLPDNYRGPANAVKPASHRVDPVLPYSPNDRSHSFITAKKTFKKRSPTKGPYLNIPNPIRPAIAKTMTVYPKPDDFFENSLWRKEMEKCHVSSKNREGNPQGSSTPYKDKSFSDSMTQTDQATNTETFEELCEAIIRQLRVQGLFDQAESRLSSMSPTFELRDETDGRGSINRVSNNACTNKEDLELRNNYKNSLLNQNNLQKDPNVHLTGCKNIKNEMEFENQEDDSHSLPELRNEIINKTLKRCQAFSALQAARSTEDMYIDDELSANNDIHALSDNMLVAPIHSSIHEALCEKANDCCLVKIKEESSNETILIVCDNSHSNNHLSNRPKSSCSYSSSSESEFEPNEGALNKIHNLKIEALPSMNLIDVPCVPQALSVIEEIPGEEDAPDSDIDNSKNIQDLISLYENKVKCKNAVNASANHTKNMRANEISFLILDNMEECDEDLPDTFDVRNSGELLSKESVIQDYIVI